ncbi:MAG TPA: hypothetical protein VER55_05225, partial [Ardenticatenaceae bacterium]|nr:hypothetical protein [Ardenticatenaceae bacterium]
GDINEEFPYYHVGISLLLWFSSRKDVALLLMTALCKCAVPGLAELWMLDKGQGWDSEPVSAPETARSSPVRGDEKLRRA